MHICICMYMYVDVCYVIYVCILYNIYIYIELKSKLLKSLKMANSIMTFLFDQFSKN